MNTFGKYQVVDKIAQGGMAEVFMGLAKARDGTHRLVALKRLNLETVQDNHIVTMFEDEARVTSRIKHPNIVRTHEFFTDGENKVLAMEFIPGCDGRTVLEASTKAGQMLPELMALTITRDICLGLEHAHAMTRSDGSPLGLIHRDISPHNMLVGYNGRTKIIDFGIVKSEVNLSRTLAGAMKGKFAYMAPEQIMSKELDHRVDIFALTASLFELLTNQRAFDAPNDFAVLEKIRLGEWGPLPAGTVKDAARISALIAKGLSSSPDDRFSAVSEFRAELESYIRIHFPGEDGHALVKMWMRRHFAANYANLKRLAQSALQREEKGGDVIAKEPPHGQVPSAPPPPPPSALNERSNVSKNETQTLVQAAEPAPPPPTISIVSDSVNLGGESRLSPEYLGYGLVVLAVLLIAIGLVI